MNTYRFRFISLFIFCIIALFLTGCATTFSNKGGMGSISDSAINQHVMLILYKNGVAPEGGNINVNTVRGIVTLSGTVDEDREARDAEMMARTVEGVKAVKNTIQVRGHADAPT